MKDGPPISSQFRHLDSEKFSAAKAEFDLLERDNIIPWSDSPWASPLHIVKKPDGSWRPCGDYCRLMSCCLLLFLIISPQTILSEFLPSLLVCISFFFLYQSDHPCLELFNFINHLPCGSRPASSHGCQTDSADQRGQHWQKKDFLMTSQQIGRAATLEDGNC